MEGIKRRKISEQYKQSKIDEKKYRRNGGGVVKARQADFNKLPLF